MRGHSASMITGLLLKTNTCLEVDRHRKPIFRDLGQTLSQKGDEAEGSLLVAVGVQAFINLADNDTASSGCEIIVSTPSTPAENQTVLDGNQTAQSQSSMPVSNETLVFPLS